MIFDFACEQISSFWDRLLGAIGDAAGNVIGSIVEAIRTAFEGDPETRRRVSFSVAIIALSAKMAKADGIVSNAEVEAFRKIFEFPPEEARNVARLYNLARQDVAGFETYANKLAGMCRTCDQFCPVLEDIIDALFHIATGAAPDVTVNATLRARGFYERMGFVATGPAVETRGIAFVPMRRPGDASGSALWQTT